MMSIQGLVFVYVVLMLGLICMAGVYSELRRRRFEPHSSQDSIFRCSRCGYVYTDDSDVDRSRCAQCGQTNDAIKF